MSPFRNCGLWYLERDAAGEFFKCIFWLIVHNKRSAVISKKLGKTKSQQNNRDEYTSHFGSNCLHGAAWQLLSHYRDECFDICCCYNFLVDKEFLVDAQLNLNIWQTLEESDYIFQVQEWS